MLHRLYVHASQQWAELPDKAVSLLSTAGAAFDPKRGAYVAEYHDEGWGAARRREFLEAGILCTYEQLEPSLRDQWQGFLSGSRGALSFNFAALLLGPLWLLFQGLFAKFFLLLGAGGFLAGIGGLVLPLLLGPSMQACWALCGPGLLLFLYPGLLGDRDRFLSEVLGESLWPSLPYRAHRTALAGFVLAGLAAAFAAIRLLGRP